MNLDGRSAATLGLAARLDVRHTGRGQGLRCGQAAGGGATAESLRAVPREPGDDDITDQLVSNIRFYGAHLAAAMLDLLPEGDDDTTGGEPAEFAQALELLEQALVLLTAAARDWAPRAVERAVERAVAFRAEGVPVGLEADRAEVAAVEPHPLGRVVVIGVDRLLVTPVSVQRLGAAV